MEIVVTLFCSSVVLYQRMYHTISILLGMSIKVVPSYKQCCSE